MCHRPRALKLGRLSDYSGPGPRFGCELLVAIDPYRKLTPSPLADPYALITGAQYTDFRCIP
jgi:hypothetical protein